MKLTNKLLAVAALLVALAPLGANAASFPQQYEATANYEKSVVLDTSGNGVTTRDGVCITHNFEEAGGNGTCAPVSNVVYFDLGKSSLNAKAKADVKAIAEKIKSTGATKIVLTGHADRSASSKFNEALSQKRVETVKQALIKRGVNGDFTIGAQGEEANAVPTADGVVEQLNRRVEVHFSK
jgi:outer membrane protein OmpA-like peptidoglycan-associated protein